MPSKRPKSDYWELCTTVNGSWGYTAAPATPLEKLLPYLITAWGMGGNVLLNVGPTREGLIPGDSADRLRQIGEWLGTNGESIYGSTAGPFDWLPWGTATRKGETLYLQVFQWPSDGILRVPLANKPLRSWLLSDPAKKILPMERSGDRIVIHLPEKAPDPVAGVIALQVEGEPVNTYTSLSLNKPVSATSAPDSAKAITDDDDNSRWKNTEGTASFTIDLGHPETFTTVRVCPRDRVANVRLEVRESGSWRTLLENAGLHRDVNVLTFPATTGDALRLSFWGNEKASEFSDFQLYPAL